MCSGLDGETLVRPPSLLSLEPGACELLGEVYCPSAAPHHG